MPPNLGKEKTSPQGLFTDKTVSHEVRLNHTTGPIQPGLIKCDIELAETILALNEASEQLIGIKKQGEQDVSSPSRIAPINEGIETAVSSPGKSGTEDQVDLVALTDELNEHFNEPELHDLCFRLKPKVDYENVKGDTKRDTVRELVTYMERRGRIEELIVLCRRLRPNVLWDANPKESKD